MNIPPFFFLYFLFIYFLFIFTILLPDNLLKHFDIKDQVINVKVFEQIIREEYGKDNLLKHFDIKDQVISDICDLASLYFSFPACVIPFNVYVAVAEMPAAWVSLKSPTFWGYLFFSYLQQIGHRLESW